MGASSTTQQAARPRRPDLPSPDSRPGREGRRGVEGLILLSGLVAILAALLMPLAPVSMSTPTVAWPVDPARPASTELQLTAFRPLQVVARFSCAAVDAAAEADGVVLATTRSGRPSTLEGLFVRLDGDELVITSNGTELHRGAVPAGDCRYAVSLSGDASTVTVDGRTVVDDPTDHRPDVDVLQTSVASLPGATDDDLSVDVRVDDQFSTSPTPAKWGLAAVLALSSLSCLVLLFRRERARPRDPTAGPEGIPGRRRGRLRHVTVADVGVVLVMVAWLFIAPMTDDDGYYAAMARNSVVNGYVGNYFQLFNQGYTPFTWFYQLLGYWDLLGHSPVLLRIPSLAAGLLTYLLVRVVVESIGLPPARTSSRRLARAAVVGAVFLTAWLPYGLGVRPESVVALLAVASLGVVIIARKRRSLAWFALGLVVAGVAFTCHPTGVVAFAPAFASVPAMWPVVRTSSPWRTLIGVVGVVAPAAVSAIPGFLDGSLNDFTRSGEIFEQWPNNQWYDEQLRYAFLLTDNPMGSYAKRIIVLLGILALVWFLALQLAAAGRRTRSWPPLVALCAHAYGLGLLLLWLTPSKWTHHFGSLAGLGAVFLSAFLIAGGRRIVATGRGRSSAPVAVLAAVSLVLVTALAWHGPNSWAYSWMIGIPQAFERPHAGPVSFDSPVLWLVVVAVISSLVARRLRRSRRSAGRISGVTAPIAVLLVLLSGLVYMVGGFSYATAATLANGTYSPWADALRDPLARDCGAQGAITAPDPSTARALGPVAGTDVTAEGFSTTGYFPSAPPPAGADGSLPVWGSFLELGGEANTGTLTTGWYALPDDRAEPDRLMVEGSGRFGNGNELVAEYGRLSGGDVVPVGRQAIDDGIDSEAWRQLGLDVPAGADAVRLVATDGTGGSGGWLAVSAPVVAQSRLLTAQIPDSATVGVSWQFAFLFPCAAQPASLHGITEPSDYLIAWGDSGMNGLDDNVFTRARGGLYHPTLRSSSLTKLDASMVGHPDVRVLQVYQVTNPFPSDAYVLDEGRTTRWGWQGS